MKKSFGIISKMPSGKDYKLHVRILFFSNDTILYQDIFHIKLEIIIYHIALSYGNNYTRYKQSE
ncbi:hypothetical protein CN907_20760 [Bacillus anthracis]|nr:hypothetical protein CN907_20760 [Bacillus anthracis]